MSYSSTNIQITLIHQEQKGLPDDTITIRKNLDYNEFEVTLKDQNSGSPLTHTMTGLYRARVIAYVYTLLKNLYIDEDNYYQVQVDLPGLPRVLVSAIRFQEAYYREHFVAMIADGLDNLESCTVTKKKVKTWQDYVTPREHRTNPLLATPRELFFDEE